MEELVEEFQLHTLVESLPELPQRIPDLSALPVVPSIQLLAFLLGEHLFPAEMALKYGVLRHFDEAFDLVVEADFLVGGREAFRQAPDDSSSQRPRNAAVHAGKLIRDVG